MHACVLHRRMQLALRHKSRSFNESPERGTLPIAISIEALGRRPRLEKWPDPTTSARTSTPWGSRPSPASPWTRCSSSPSRRSPSSSSPSSSTSTSADTASPAPSLRSSPAYVVIGGMGLRNAIVHVDVDNVEDMYGGYISAARVLYMFLVGLDVDIAALRNATRRCVAFTYATVAASLLVAAIVSSGMYGSMMHSPVKTPELLAATLMLALANTSSIAVSRIASELKLTVTENGRLVVAAAIFTNIICVFGDGVLVRSPATITGENPSINTHEHNWNTGDFVLR